jgi:cell division septation protein DedD
MALNDEGEFELVMGNRQLLSVFFILVVLMGVFFAMGYIVGRNNPSKEAAELAARPESIDANAAEKRGAIIVDPNTTKPSPVVEKTFEPVKPAEDSKPADAKPANPPKPVETKRAEKPKPEPPKPVETKQAEKPKPVESKPAEKPKVAEKPRPIEISASGAPAAGQTFLQIVAIDKAGASALVETLQKKSFSAVVAPGPSEKIFRVLVGPLKDQAAIAKTKIDLEGIGFKGPIVRKY